MANHKSAEKRARQIKKRTEENQQIRGRARTKTKAALKAKPDQQTEAVREAFSAIQKAKRVFHKNAIKRKMSRLSKALKKKEKASAASSA